VGAAVSSLRETSRTEQRVAQSERERLRTDQSPAARRRSAGDSMEHSLGGAMGGIALDDSRGRPRRVRC